MKGVERGGRGGSDGVLKQAGGTDFQQGRHNESRRRDEKNDMVMKTIIMRGGKIRTNAGIKQTGSERRGH